jgi:hypothetical protein
MNLPTYFTPMELEELYGIPAVDWRRWAYKGIIRSFKAHGKLVLIPAREVTRILNKLAPMTTIYQEWKDQLT